MRSLIFLAVSSLFISSVATAKVNSGTYNCHREGKVVKIVKVAMEKLGGIELPILDFTYPLATDIKRSGVGIVIRIEGSTHYVLGGMDSISFSDDGSIRSDDLCSRSH